MPRRAEKLAAMAVLVLAACKPLPVNLSQAQQSFGSRDYERIFERWTRDAQAYNLDTLENALTVSATYRSWEFRQAWVQRYADDYRLTPEKVEALVEEQRVAHDSSHEFIVTATANKPKWADFTRKDTPWTIALVNDVGGEVAPMDIEKLDPGPEMLAYYTTITIYRNTFLFNFPRSGPGGQDVLDPSIGSFSLLFTGALGRAELTWKVFSEPSS